MVLSEERGRYMNPISAWLRGGPPTRSQAWSYAMINQFATPGLGTLLARRFITGSFQLVFAVAGCVCILIWWLIKMCALYGQIYGTQLTASSGNRIGWAGLALFLTAWFWSLISSIQIVCAVPKDSGLIPPKIVPR